MMKTNRVSISGSPPGSSGGLRSRSPVPTRSMLSGPATGERLALDYSPVPAGRCEFPGQRPRPPSRLSVGLHLEEHNAPPKGGHDPLRERPQERLPIVLPLSGQGGPGDPPPRRLPLSHGLGRKVRDYYVEYASKTRFLPRPHGH